MHRPNLGRWAGFFCSLISTMFCGIAMSFNTYAVKLKESLRLDQTQVELVGSFAMIGFASAICGSVIFKKCGFAGSYGTAATLTALSGVGMELSMQYAEIFRRRIGLLCLFQFLSTSGAAIGLQCLSEIGLRHWPEKTGKVIGVYFAFLGSGKIYYSALVQIFFRSHDTLQGFFMTTSLSLLISFSLCYIFHRPPVTSGDADVILPDKSEYSPLAYNAGEKSLPRKLFTSGYFYSLLVSTAIFQACMMTFLNNATGMAASVGVSDPITVVYPLTVVLIMSRIICGAVFDYFGSQATGAALLLVCNTSFIGAMLIAMFALNDLSVYAMISLASVGNGAGVSLPLSMMTSYFGADSYGYIVGINEVAVIPIVMVLHFLSGISYESAAVALGARDLFCGPCFYWTYVMLLASAACSCVINISLLVTCSLSPTTSCLL